MPAVQPVVYRNPFPAAICGKLVTFGKCSEHLAKQLLVGPSCAPVHFGGSARRCKQSLTRTKAIVHDAAPAQSLPTSDLISLPLDYYKLLQLTSSSTQQACKRAYETLIHNPPNLGLSRAAILNRERVLAQASLYVVDPETRRLYDDTLSRSAAQVEVEYDDLPGVFCLLYEANDLGTVVEWGKAWLREHYDDPRARDVAILVAMSYWDGGVTVLESDMEAVVVVSYSLEDGLEILKRHQASPELQEKIFAAIQELRPPVSLKLVSLPLDATFAEQRTRGLQLLQSMFDSNPQQYFKNPNGLSNYLTAVRAQLTTSEQALVLSKITLTIDSTVEEAFEVALGYIAEGCKNYQPMLIKKAEDILEKYSGKLYGSHPSSDLNPLDITVGRAVCQILLGRMERAMEILGLTMDTQDHADPLIKQFIAEHSTSVSDPTPAIIFLAQRWLEDIAFSTCREAAPDGPFSLDNWLDNGNVKIQMKVLESGGDKVIEFIEQVNKTVGEATKTITGAPPKTEKVPSVDYDEYSSSNGSDWSSQGVGGDTAVPLDQQERALWKEQYQPEQRSPWGLITVAGFAALAVAAVLFRDRLPRLPSNNSIPSQTIPTAQVSSRSVAPPIEVSSTTVPAASVTMTPQEAHTIVKQWQATKAEALGPKHAMRKLDGILTANMLDQWKQRAADVKDSGWHWEYHLSGMSIDDVRDVPGNQKSVIVQASFDEVACIVEEGEVQESYANKYAIQYELVKEGSKWKIATGHILNY